MVSSIAESRALIGIIGGTGFYELLSQPQELALETPYGATSAPLHKGELMGREIVFLARHGKGHKIPPHRVNSRANIWALRELGVERVIAPSAVGSLQEQYAPGHLLIPDQFIDFTKKRTYTFYEGDPEPVYHISTADPFCEELRVLFIEGAEELGLVVHRKGTYVCIEGPRFSTRAESRMFRSFGDVIGMTLVPECQLAREKELCFVSLALVTDYDVWAERPVSAREVIETLKKNVRNLKKLLGLVVPRIPKERGCACKHALRHAKI